MTENNDIE